MIGYPIKANYGVKLLRNLRIFKVDNLYGLTENQ